MTTYNFSVLVYNDSAPVEIDPQCNSLNFINTGSTVAEVNGVPLNPGIAGVSNGESFSIGGNQDEIFKGRVDINFPAGAGSLTVVQKYYLPV